MAGNNYSNAGDSSIDFGSGNYYMKNGKLALDGDASNAAKASFQPKSPVSALTTAEVPSSSLKTTKRRKAKSKKKGTKKGAKHRTMKKKTLYSKKKHVAKKSTAKKHVAKKHVAKKSPYPKGYKPIQHASYIYDSNGIRIDKNTGVNGVDPSDYRSGHFYDSLDAYDNAVHGQTKTLKNGRKYYQVGEDAFIKASNVDGRSRQLDHNAYVYHGKWDKKNKKLIIDHNPTKNSKGKRKLLKAGSTARTYGADFEKTSDGNSYYRIGKGQYVKAQNFTPTQKNMTMPHADAAINIKYTSAYDGKTQVAQFGVDNQRKIIFPMGDLASFHEQGTPTNANPSGLRIVNGKPYPSNFTMANQALNDNLKTNPALSAYQGYNTGSAAVTSKLRNEMFLDMQSKGLDTSKYYNAVDVSSKTGFHGPEASQVVGAKDYSANDYNKAAEGIETPHAKSMKNIAQDSTHLARQGMRVDDPSIASQATMEQVSESAPKKHKTLKKKSSVKKKSVKDKSKSAKSKARGKGKKKTTTKHISKKHTTKKHVAKKNNTPKPHSRTVAPLSQTKRTSIDLPTFTTVPGEDGLSNDMQFN